MRLEVFCEDRLGLTRELLDLLVSRGIDLRGIEIDPSGRIYLNFAEQEFDAFRTLMTEIRLIHGVTDVRTVTFMPSESKHRALQALLASLPEPVLSIDSKGKVTSANPAALTLFSLAEDRIQQQPVSNLINGYNVTRGIDDEKPLSDKVKTHSERRVINGQDFLVETTPITLESELASPQVGAVLMLRSALRMGRQWQQLNEQDSREFQPIVAESTVMRQVIIQAQKFSMLDAPLLIVGDTGTGKDMLAQACHRQSPRSQYPFLALNCAALPDDVAESELFGHAPGAYPNALEGKKGFFEQANGGSVLLDEIGEMSPQMQVKLLRFLNDGTFRRVGEEHEVHVNVRVICATQKNLTELVQQGIFREDLYYRLNVLTLTLPPLRERLADIFPLTALFAARFADEQGMDRPTLSSTLKDYLCSYPWPGNVRQLKNVIYRALTQLPASVLTPREIDLPNVAQTTLPLESETLEGSLDEINKRFERVVLMRLYSSFPSTRKLAKRLNMSHTAIANKLREYGLSNKRALINTEEESGRQQPTDDQSDG